MAALVGHVTHVHFSDMKDSLLAQEGVGLPVVTEGSR